MKYFITVLARVAGFDPQEKSYFVTTDDLERYWHEYIQSEPSSHVYRILTVTPLPEPPTK